MNTQKYFGTNDLYKILEVDRSAEISEGIKPLTNPLNIAIK